MRRLSWLLVAALGALILAGCHRGPETADTSKESHVMAGKKQALTAERF